MNSVTKISTVLESHGSTLSLTELVDEISKKYHIVNDENLFTAIKYAYESNKHLFEQFPTTNINSQLSKIITFEKFEKAYSSFIEQADKNVMTKKGEGPKTPLGFDGDNVINNWSFSQHFGQGAASRTPYVNWFVISIYYVIESAKIIVGIEKERYPHLDKMNPIKIEELGKKGRYVAVFYECNKNNTDYKKLYEHFISVSEQVINLGLQ